VKFFWKIKVVNSREDACFLGIPDFWGQRICVSNVRRCNTLERVRDKISENFFLSYPGKAIHIQLLLIYLVLKNCRNIFKRNVCAAIVRMKLCKVLKNIF
jgi:hypothetical protein